MCLCLKQTFDFQKQLDLLNMSGYCCFPGFAILHMMMHLTACLVFCLVKISLLKLLGLKINFHSPSELGQVLFITLKLIVKAKRRKFIIHVNLLKAFIFQHGLNLKLFFFKSKAQLMKLICYVTLGRLGSPFRGHRNDSKYHPKVGEYSTGGVGKFVEFL